MTRRPKPRRKSPLSRRMSERARSLSPQPLEATADEGRTTPSRLTFCDLLYEAIGRRSCGDVDCGRCTYLLDHLESEHPDYCWVCSTCTEGFSLLPYWADGRCDSCGFPSSVLMLVVPLSQ